jgi:hypothetical protein
VANGRKQAIVRGTKQHPLSGQIAMARAAACFPIHVLGKSGPKADDLRYTNFPNAVRTFRSVDTICIPYLYTIADPDSAKRGYLAEYFNECIEEIEARKPVIVELSSGLRSDDPKQRRELLRLARRAVISGGKGLRRDLNTPLGRKVLKFDDAVLAKCELIWRDTRRFRTELQAADAMKLVNKRFTRQRARKFWGPRKKRET